MFALKMKFLIASTCLLQNAFKLVSGTWWNFTTTTIDRTWWKHTTMYQVYLPSFMDSDGDGYGDFKGLASKLDHFVELGIETILITPHYPSPNMRFAGYDIKDYFGVNQLLGSMQDFDELIKEMNKRGLKLIIDIVMNHSGNKHPWFIKSVHREDPYTDYYIWQNAKGYDNRGNPIPPNNWRNIILEGSAWKWNEQREQFYLHQFVEEMPDLNLRNNLVLKYSSFGPTRGSLVLDSMLLSIIVEDEQLRNEPRRNLSTKVSRKYDDNLNMFTRYQEDSLEVIQKIRMITDYLTTKSGDFERIIVPEVYSKNKELYQYYGTNRHKLAHFPFNYWLAKTIDYENAYYYRNVIEGYLNCLPRGAVANWISENHDLQRKASVFNKDYQFILTTMVLLLPGISYIYYGQELGMTGWHFPNENQDDSFRLPMQWDDTMNAGFTTNPKPHLPINPEYREVNVKKQKSDENSNYNKVKTMLSWKKTDALKYGSFKSYVLSTWVYSFTRRLEDEIYLVTFNVGNETQYVRFKHSIKNLPHRMVVKLASSNSDYEMGDVISTRRKFRLVPQSTVVLYPKRI